MISLNKLILEGRYDSMITQLSRELLAVIKLSHTAVNDPEGKFAGEKKIYYKEGESVPNIDSNDQKAIYFKEVENEIIPLEFHLMLKVQWIEGLNDLRKGGDAYTELYKTKVPTDPMMPLIEIRFELDPADFPNLLSKVAMYLREILRHEIEHTTQSGWNLLPGKYMRGDQYLRSKINSGELPSWRYFTLPKEVDANIQGLNFYAKKSKISLKQAASDYLDEFVFNNTISEEDKQKILSIWQKRIPKLGLHRDIV